jgi:hypothetical protein
VEELEVLEETLVESEQMYATSLAASYARCFCTTASAAFCAACFACDDIVVL